MTALPIVETQASDVSAFIPTNVISILMVKFFWKLKCFIVECVQLLSGTIG